LIKTGANIADTRRAIEISHSYLPNTIADELSIRAREFYALDTLNKASKLLDQHNISAAIAQIREGLKCSDSSEVLRSLTFLLTATQSLPLLKLLASLLLSTELDQLLDLLPDDNETYLNAEFELRDINLIIFPDWDQPEELLHQNLANVISSLVTHPDQHRMALFIENSVISDEDANLIVSGVIFNLLQQTNLDIAEELEISLVGNLTERQWKFLLQRIQARIILKNENKSVIQQIKAESIPSCELEKLDTQIRVDLLCY
jgi:hypothetical protein